MRSQVEALQEEKDTLVNQKLEFLVAAGEANEEIERLKEQVRQLRSQPVAAPTPELMEPSLPKPVVEQAALFSELAVQSEPDNLSQQSLLKPVAAPLETVGSVECSTAPGQPEALTRKELGHLLGVSHEAIRQWEKQGKIIERGWEPIKGTGDSPKNPRLYRKI